MKTRKESAQSLLINRAKTGLSRPPASECISRKCLQSREFGNSLFFFDSGASIASDLVLARPDLDQERVKFTKGCPSESGKVMSVAIQMRSGMEPDHSPSHSDPEVVELTLLIPQWQAQILETAAERRGMTTGQMLRRVISDLFGDNPQTRVK